MEIFWLDIRFAFRSLAKQPVFCCAAILTLALGIGANSAIFSIFDAAILRPLPYREPERLVLVWQKRPDGRQNPVSGMNYFQWTTQARSFEQLIGFLAAPYNVAGRGEPVQAGVARVSSGLFSCLGVRPALGRDFTLGEDKIGAPHVAIVTFEFWRRQFGGDQGILDTEISINGESYTVIGVLPAGFYFFAKEIDVWTPLGLGSKEALANNMIVLGRLRPRATIQEADREMEVIAKRLESQFPQTNKGWGAQVMFLQDYLTRDIRPALRMLLAAVGFVLLICCANVANLLLARSESRYQEISVRSALGASRIRLLRQALMEAMLLGLAGGLAGLGLAYAGLRLLLGFHELTRVDGARMDARVLAFTFLVALITSIAFGLFPARQLLDGDLNLALRESGRSSISTRGGRRSRNVLVVSEIALSLVLLIGASLMIQSLLRLGSASRGFVPKNLLTFRVSLPVSRFRDPVQMAAYYLGMLEKLETVPGVRAVGANTNLPLDGQRWIGMYYSVEGTAAIPLPERTTARANLVNPGYLKTLGIPIVQGRAFDARDQNNAPPVAIMSSALARRCCAGENPIGRRLMLGSPGGAGYVAREIVGVAGDIRYPTQGGDESLEIYLPYVQVTWPLFFVALRADRDPEKLAPAVRAAMHSFDQEQPLTDVYTMEERIARLNNKPRLNSLLAGIFAVLALALAAVGIYGVISYSTAQRTREIGVRMALGATRQNIVGWIVRQALVLAAGGVAIGLAGHFVLSGILRTLLYGTSPLDMATLAGAAVVLTLIAALASYIPARRAVRGDPVAALRAE